MKKILLLVFVSISVTSGLLAQDSTGRKGASSPKEEKKQRINAIIKQEEEGNLSFTKQSAFGVQLRTNGYGFFYELGRRRSARFTNTYSIELSEIKHKKEEKVSGSQNIFSNSFFYGKINNFYQAKLGFGQQFILGQKGNKNGVAVLGIVQGGLSVGLLKPYYVEVQDGSGRQRVVSYEQDSVQFLGSGILGPGGIGKGWNELKVKPGAYIKTALRFDFGRYNDNIQALEIGMSLEAYAQKIPIMVYNDPKQLFFQGHVAFVFGRRK